MILDLITNKNSNICVSKYSDVSDALRGTVIRRKTTSDLLWEIDFSTAIADIRVGFEEPINFKKCVIDFSTNFGVVNKDIMYQYSYDGKDWINFKYVQFAGGADEYSGTYGKLVTETATSSVYRWSSDFSKLDDYYKTNSITVTGTDILTVTPIFINPITQDYIYTDLKFKYFRVILQNIAVTGEGQKLYLSTFELYGDEVIESVKEPLLMLTKDRIFKQSFWESNIFLPDQIGTFLSMLESNSYVDRYRYENFNSNLTIDITFTGN